MPKLKTRKSAAKRVKIKKSCLLRKKAFKSHLMKSKNSKRIRNLSKQVAIHSADMYTFLLMNPYN
jgi:ribosomal protein L35